MSGYLPLCAFRQGLLPAACSSCAWWQTTGGGRLSPEAAADARRRWITSVEGSWGTPGLLLQGDDNSTGGAPAPAILASINFAPAAAVPRLRDLPFGLFGSFTDGPALVFCLTCGQDQPQYQAKRVLHKALKQLETRGIGDVYAVAAADGAGLRGALDRDRCRFFPVTESGGLILMRVDLRGLLTLVGRLQAAVRRALHDEPTPSPAAWTRHETS
jgi:hypothetical protein